MAGEFDGKVAFITGAAHGQGRAVSLALAAQGARIVGYDIARQIAYPGYKLGTSEDLRALEEEVKAKGSEALVFTGDVRDDSAISKAGPTAWHDSGESTSCSTMPGFVSTANPTS